MYAFYCWLNYLPSVPHVKQAVSKVIDEYETAAEGWNVTHVSEVKELIMDDLRAWYGEHFDSSLLQHWKDTR